MARPPDAYNDTSNTTNSHSLRQIIQLIHSIKICSMSHHEDASVSFAPFYATCVTTRMQVRLLCLPAAANSPVGSSPVCSQGSDRKEALLPGRPVCFAPFCRCE